MRGRTRRDKQAGRVIVRLLGDSGEILFPDRGSAPLTLRVRKYQDRPRAGHGSHLNGRHKLG